MSLNHRIGQANRDRNTYARGERCRHAKLTRDQVVEILDLIERRDALRAEVKRLTNAAIAERYGVSQRAIENIATGQTWRHV